MKVKQIAVVSGSLALWATDLSSTAAKRHQVQTPFGDTVELTERQLGPTDVLHLDRHCSTGERRLAHLVNYRANLWALHERAVGLIIALFTCGAVADRRVGSLVVPSQLISFTHKRPDSFDHLAHELHTSFAVPFDRKASEVARSHLRADDGTIAVIDGPRFSTLAESQMLAALGCTHVNMTLYPESILARELGISYVAIGLVTDHDARSEDGYGVSLELIEQQSRQHAAALREALASLLPTLATAEVSG